jgi:hypothetical protein
MYSPERVHWLRLTEITDGIDRETVAFNNWNSATLMHGHAGPSPSLAYAALKLYEAASCLKSSVLVAASTRAFQCWETDWEWPIYKQEEHNTGQSSDAPQLLEEVPLATDFDYESWVTQAKTYAMAECDLVVRELESEGLPDMAKSLRELRVCLLDANSTQEAADLYMLFSAELMVGPRFNRLRNFLQDVVVRLSREEVGLESRGDFDRYMRESFGKFLEADDQLVSRLHQSFKICAAQQPLQGFHSNTVTSREHRPRIRHLRPRDVERKMQLQQQQQQRQLQPFQQQQQQQQQEAVIAQQQVEESTWIWLGDRVRPPAAGF